MATIHIDTLPKPVAVGLEWHALPGRTSERKEIDALAKETGAKIGCVVGDDESGVTVLGIAHERAPGAPCGAAWLAKASNREAIVLVEPIGDNKLWMCAVKAGTPVQNLDIVVDLSALHEKLPEFLADSPDARICSTLENLHTSYQNVSPQSFAELVSSTKPEKLVRIAGVSPMTVLGIGSAVIVLGAYFGGGAWLEQAKRKESAAKLAVLAERQKAMDAEQLRKAEAAHREKGIAVLQKSILKQPALGAAIPAMFGVMENVPLSVAGWSLAGFDCTPAACQLNWSREKNGTILSFMRAADERTWELKSAAGDQAVTVHPVEIAAREAGVDVIEENDAFRAALETKLQEAQLAGLRYDMSKMEAVELLMQKDDAPPGAAGAPGSPPPLPWKVGGATVKGSMLFELRAMPDYLDHAAVALVGMKADLKLKEWTLEIKYATR